MLICAQLVRDGAAYMARIPRGLIKERMRDNDKMFTQRVRSKTL
jgi:hypothetical protein